MQSENVDLKKTVNLPKTDFPMKANLPTAELKMLERWQGMNLYQRIRDSRSGRPTYILHDGPPYANGNIHLGHAFNKILKDFIVKSRTMAGFDSPYVPGWDCHGLPIEIKVDGELGSKKARMSIADIRRECRKYASKYVELQKQDFQRLLVFGRWDDPYLTMSSEYQAAIAGAFVDFLHQGYVYKGLKPVNWCINDRTALAEAEVEYENHTSPSIWVRFALKSSAAKIDPALAGRHVFGLIWTTTPWTMPANVAISYHPKFEYSAVEVNGGDVYIVATDLLKTTAEACTWAETKTLASFPGERLEHAVFQHPFLDRDSIGLLGEHVTLEQGTGAVHTAPGHGQEDFDISRKYGIATYCPVDGAGRFYHAEGAAGTLPSELIGKTVWEANPIVIKILNEHFALCGVRKLEHSYPHCWRCHKPTIFRATEQWFIGMERNNLRGKALEAIRNVKWHPAWGEDRMYNMIAGRPDWCISRQRVWGVPIVVFYCESCNETLTDRKILDRVVNLFREHSADVWYEKSAAELIGDESVHCAKCGGASFRKESDILDVWFDSGSSHLAVLTAKNELPWPSDMYLEGGDQYRGWFHSSLLVGAGLRGASPYRNCATNGWTLDGEGRAMSKSLGNVISPHDLIKQGGADVLRLWVSSVEFWEDVFVTPETLKRISEAYRKLRNTFRYTLGNLDGFDPVVDSVPGDEMLEIDRWILGRAAELVKNVHGWYDEYAYHKIFQAVYNFAGTDLSAVYCDILKDRLYTTATKSKARRSGQTALYRLTYALVRLLAPILAYTTEEVWLNMRRPAGAPESVHIALLPEPEELTAGVPPVSEQNWARLMEVRDQVLKPLEAARRDKLIGAGLEARVTLGAGPDLLPLLESYAADLPAIFVVSQVQLKATDGALTVDVERAHGVKCERCWKYTFDVGSDADFPTVCRPCAEAVKEILGA